MPDEWQVQGKNGRKSTDEKLNLLAEENIVLSQSSESGQYVLAEHRIQAVISKFTEGRPGLEKLPIALITVLGSDNHSLRKYHTDWLINYFENGGESNNMSSGPRRFFSKKLEFLKFNSAPSPGVYIWPKPCIIPAGSAISEEEIICFIIHVEDPYDGFLEKFASLASTDVIVFNKSEQLHFESKSKSLGRKVLPSFHIYSKSYISTQDGSELNQGHCPDFLHHLAGIRISKMINSKSTRVTLKSLLRYLRSRVDTINSQLGTASRANVIEPEMSTLTPTHGQSVVTQQPLTTAGSKAAFVDTQNAKTDRQTVKQSEETKTLKQAQEASTDKKEQETGPQNTKSREASKKTPADKPKTEIAENVIATGNNMPHVPCESLNCNHLQQQLADHIIKWLNTSMNPANIHQMLECVHHLHHNDKHDVLAELGNTVNIIIILRNEISNMFDNYVCFDGDLDKMQMLRFCDNAQSNAEKALKEKNHAHSQLASNIMKKACDIIRRYFLKENENIVRREKNMAAGLIAEIIEAYKKKMTLHMEKNSKIADITTYHKMLENHCVLLVDRCMEAQARINGVVAGAVKLLKNKLGEEMQTIAREAAIANQKQLLNQKDNPIEFSINMYLSLFDEQIKPQLGIIEFDKLKIIHEEIDKIVIAHLANFYEKEIVSFRLYTHFVYFWEVEQIRRQAVTSATLDKKSQNQYPLCIYLTSDWLRVDTMLSSEQSSSIVFGSGKEKTKEMPAFAAITDKHQVVFGFQVKKMVKAGRKFTLKPEKLVKFVLQNTPQSITVLTEVFRNLKDDSEVAFKMPYTSAVITVPLQFGPANRLCLRRCILQAGFREVYLVSESSLAVYSQLRPQRVKQLGASIGVDMSAVIALNVSGVRLELYRWCGNEQTGCCKLLAGTFQNWENSNSKSEKGEKKRLTGHKNPFSPTEHPHSDCVKSLEMAFEDVKAQILTRFLEKPTSYIIISEKPEYENIFAPFFKQHPNWQKVSEFRNDHALPMALEFSKEPLKITKRIVDHAAHIDSIISDILVTSDEINDNSVLDSSNEAISTEQTLDPELEQLKEDLLFQCMAMRKQIDKGEIKIRVLMKKLVIDAIQRAEATAKNTDATKVMIEAQQAEIFELCEEHHFNIPTRL